MVCDTKETLRWVKGHTGNGTRKGPGRRGKSLSKGLEAEGSVRFWRKWKDSVAGEKEQGAECREMRCLRLAGARLYEALRPRQGDPSLS